MHNTPKVGPITRVQLGQTIRGFIEAVVEEDEITDKTREKSVAALRLIERFFGSDYDLGQIKGADCRSFRSMLGQLPPNLTKLWNDKEALADIARVNAEHGGRTISPNTQIFYLRTLNRLLGFATDERLIFRNPFPTNLQPKGEKRGRETARNAFSDAQLQRIFQAPLFTGCVNDERGFSKPLLGHVTRRSRFWVPLIGLFTGLRMNEILQLTGWHIRLAPDGLPCFLIGANMKLKTSASYRVVPMHGELIRIGLPEFAMRTGENCLLFGDVPAGSDGYRSSNFSKRFGVFWRSLKANEPGRIVSFHSFRHNFRDALRLPHINPDLVKEIAGWSRGGEVSDGYGDGARAVHLRPLIDSVTYDLNLRHLYVSTADTA